MPEKVVVSDTSCLIVLTNIQELTLLQRLYQKVYITPTIAEEFGDTLPNWIESIPVKDAQKQKMLEFHIDAGEASAITLSLEILASLIIIDDFKARQIAEKLGLKITGTLGMIVKAKNQSLIGSIRPIIAKLRKTDFRISQDLIDQALKLANE